MGSIDVTGWPPTKVIAAVEAIRSKHRGAPIQLSWETARPGEHRPTEDPIDAARRLQLRRDNLKG